MDLSVREVAHLLALPEKSVTRLAREGTLPSYKIHDQYRFNRVELQEWAATTGHKVSPDLWIGAARAPSLIAAVERGGVRYDLPGATPTEVLTQVSQLPEIPAEIDRTLLRELLVGREALASTGIGGGIALPHPRDPLIIQVSAPVIVICFLAQPVDFHAIDGQPVRVLFTLISPTIKLHLETLSRLAFVLHDQGLHELLANRAPRAALLARIRSLEEGTR